MQVAYIACNKARHLRLIRIIPVLMCLRLKRIARLKDCFADLFVSF